MFFWNSLDFSMIKPVLAIWSLVPLLFLNPACTSGISWFKYWWSLAWRILSIILLACEMCIVYGSLNLTLPLFEIGMKTDLFQSCGHCQVFQICWHTEYNTLTASCFKIWNSCCWPVEFISHPGANGTLAFSLLLVTLGPASLLLLPPLHLELGVLVTHLLPPPSLLLSLWSHFPGHQYHFRLPKPCYPMAICR